MAPLPALFADLALGDAAFFSIAQVADALRLPQHVLRFWEGEFSHIKPMKRAGGRRYYRQRDIEALLRIQDLLHNQGYTIRGAQQLFASERKNGPALPTQAGKQAMKAELTSVRSELEDILSLLES
jgi:DNA-binding transcriptional MerR regulator